MADQKVIREFLVKLGFKQDEASLKKFTNGVEGATKNVFKLVAAIQGASLTIAAGVAAFSSKLEDMYFQAKRAGSSASSLKAVEQAIQNINGAGDDALSSVQALATFIRNQPGSVGFLKALGVDALDAKGNMRDMADIMVDVGRAMRDKPFYLAKMQAGQLGIGEETLRAMLDPSFESKLRKQQELLANSNFDKAARDANKFMESMRELLLVVQIFAVQVQEALMNRLGISIQTVSEWMRTHGDLIAQRIIDITLAIIGLAEKIAPAIGWVIEKFIALDKATDGWSTKIAALIVVLRMLGAGSLISGIFGLATAMGALSLPILAIAGAAAGGAWLGTKIYEWMDEKRAEMAGGGKRSGKGGNRPSSAPISGAADPVKFFMGLGWSKDQAAGIVANLKAESNLDPHAQGDGGKAYGIAQWHPDRRANFEKWAGYNIENSTLEDQMKFVNYELTQGSEQKAGKMLRAATNARQAGRIVSEYYERPAARMAESGKRGEMAATIAQTTNINVNGSSDPSATARAVASEQVRVNADITRNMELALR